MAEANPTIPNELQLYIREQLARIEQLHTDAEKKRQEIEAGPKLLRLEVWKVVVAALAAGGLLGGAIVGGLTYATRQPPAPIVIQLPASSTR